MKIVDKKTFYELPDGTLFSEYTPSSFHGLMIKGETITKHQQKDVPFDYYEMDIIGNVEDDSTDILIDAEETGKSLKLEFDTGIRNVLYDPTQLYAVYEQVDIDALIETLKKCKGV